MEFTFVKNNKALIDISKEEAPIVGSLDPK